MNEFKQRMSSEEILGDIRSPLHYSVIFKVSDIFKS